LLSSTAAKTILSAIPHAESRTIDGPHLLLQTAPEACARAVADFAAGLVRQGTMPSASGSRPVFQ
jgi:hypothetical protein